MQKAACLVMWTAYPTWIVGNIIGAIEFKDSREAGMKVHKQLSVFLENEPGTLARVCTELAQKQIDVLAHSVADSIDYAVFRFIASDPIRAVHLLESAGSFVLETDVLGMDIDNKPGTLASIAQQLAKANINIEYAYGSAAPDGSGSAFLVLKTDDLSKTMKTLKVPGTRSQTPRPRHPGSRRGRGV